MSRGPSGPLTDRDPMKLPHHRVRVNHMFVYVIEHDRVEVSVGNGNRSPSPQTKETRLPNRSWALPRHGMSMSIPATCAAPASASSSEMKPAEQPMSAIREHG